MLFIGILTACSKSAPEPVEYMVEMSEFAFTPASIEVQVGQPVVLQVVNRGVLEHEIMFGQQAKMMDNQPDGYVTEMFSHAGIEPEISTGMGMMEGEHDSDHPGVMVVLQKTGDQATISFTPTEDMVGEWEIGCFVQGGTHYNAGMKGKLVVKP
jgi:uncharacterized cupredoxin-like copper-binding protein